MGYPIEVTNRIMLFIFLLYQAPLHDTLCGELHIMKSVFVYMLWARVEREKKKLQPNPTPLEQEIKKIFHNTRPPPFLFQ